jgi:glycosyltransferase involved in cell wall biosynthesis
MIKSKTIRRKCIVVPNGFDDDTIYPRPECRDEVRARHGIKNNEKLVFFFGKLDYQPNTEALEVIRNHLAEGFQRNKIRVLVAGLNLPKAFALSEPCTYVGPVEDIGEYINAADAVIVPLESGGGTRLKIIEALACGIPVISTRIGAEGIPTNRLKGLLSIADDGDWEQFTLLVNKVLSNPPTRVQIQNTLAEVRKYSWKNVVRKPKFLLQKLRG